MKKIFILCLLISGISVSSACFSQINENSTGAWYMYFWNTSLQDSSFGFQGDVQYRNWDTIGDLEQLLIRGGLTYSPKNHKVKFTLGFANITSGTYGNSSRTTSENRIYQEALIPQQIGERVYLTHRFRYEQRFVDNQDFRTRWRYALFLTIPLNQTTLGKGTVYFAAYNEIFLNGQRDIGNGRKVDVFDRNRTYAALGYNFADNIKMQFGYMKQNTNTWDKGQMQLSLHHKF